MNTGWSTEQVCIIWWSAHVGQQGVPAMWANHCHILHPWFQIQLFGTQAGKPELYSVVSKFNFRNWGLVVCGLQFGSSWHLGCCWCLLLCIGFLIAQLHILASIFTLEILTRSTSTKCCLLICVLCHLQLRWELISEATWLPPEYLIIPGLW